MITRENHFWRLAHCDPAPRLQRLCCLVNNDDVESRGRSKELVAASCARGRDDFARGKNFGHSRKLPLLELFAQQFKFLFDNYNQ